jgi:signal transduction histidine kinase
VSFGISPPLIPYLLLLLGTATLSSGLSVLAWRRREIPGAPIFAVLMATIGEWTLAYALEMASADRSTKLFFDQFEYIGIVATPVAALAFAVEYTARGHRLTPIRLSAVAAVPVTTLILLWSNPTHGFVQASVEVDLTGPISSMVIAHGPWFWIHIAYSYLLLAIAASLIFASLLRSPRMYWGQIGAMLVGVITPLLTNVAYLSGRFPIPHLDPTPFAFTVTGLAMFVALFRLRFLDLFLGLPLVSRRILMTRLPDAVVLVDAHGTIVETNASAFSVFQTPGSRMVGRRVEAVFPEWRTWALDDPISWPQHAEIRRGLPEATRVYDVLRTPEYVRGTHLVGWVLVLREITARKRLEVERVEALARAEAARAEAEEAVRQRDDFLAIAAHEIKTPITTLRLTAETLPRLMDRGLSADTPQVRRALKAIDQQSVKLAQLVVELLDLSHLRAGRLTVSRTRENLADLVRTSVEQAQAQTNRHTIVLTAPTEAMAYIDALRFTEVLTNLLDNALKFSPNGEQIDVTLATVPPDKVVLTVRDRGLGIPVDRREKIFELFYQAHSENHRSGMGIGLYLVRQIVELHGGQVTADFPSDGGTCFRVELPTGQTNGMARTGTSATNAEQVDRRG